MTLDAMLREAQATFRIPALSVAIVEGDEITYAQGFGATDTAGTVGPETPFIIGSVSKTITALAVADLAEQGVIDLAAPVRTYLPWFRLQDETAAARITVRDLLHHTSGLPESAGVDLPTGADGSIRTFVERLASVRPVGDVGRTYAYSSANYNVLGAIIEAVTGDPYGRHIEQTVFQPLDMRTSYTDLAAAQRAGLVRGHTSVFGFPRPVDERVDPGGVPSGYLVSSSADLARLVRALLNEGRYDGRAVFSPASIQRLQDDVVPTVSGAAYGLGLFVGTMAGEPAVWHHGGTAGYAASLVLLPRQR